MQVIHVIKGQVSDPEAYPGSAAQAGQTEWQFSDGPPGKRGASNDYLSLEDGIQAHPNCAFVFYL